MENLIRKLNIRKQKKIEVNWLFMAANFLWASALISIYLFGNSKFGEVSLTGSIIHFACAFIHLNVAIKSIATAKSIEVYPNKIIINYNNKSKTYFYKDIKKIETAKSSRTYLIKFSLFNQIRISSNVERFEYIAKAIYKVNPTFFKMIDNWDEYIQNLIKYDHQAARENKVSILKYFFFLPTLLTVLMLIFQNKLQGIQINSGVVVTSFSYLIFLTIIFFVGYFIVSSKVLDKKTIDGLRRNLELEEKFEKLSKPIIFSAYFLVVFSMAITNVNTYWYKAITNKATFLGLKDGNKYYLYDVKYNCIDCNYSVEKEDLILARKGRKTYIGKVIGFPNESHQYKTTNNEGRSISSTETVPKDHILILTDDEKQTILIKTDSIRSKILK